MEKELEVQIGMKQEMEMSMKMLEKDICEKQDALMELRQQLEDLRAINQQLLHRSQVGLLHHRTPRNMAAGLSRECSKGTATSSDVSSAEFRCQLQTEE